MARLPRLAVPGQFHLWLQRSNGGHPVFIDDEDHRLYLSGLKDHGREHGVAVHAYALLPTQVLLLLTPVEATSLSRFAQAQGRRFGAAYNRRHQREGVLWEGRFRSTVVEAAAHYLDAVGFVEGAPVDFGLVERATDHRWSSAAHHTGLRVDPVITEHPRHWTVGNTPFERESVYRGRLDRRANAVERHRLMEAVLRGWPVGSHDFLAGLQSSVFRRLSPSRPGRPKKPVPN